MFIQTEDTPNPETIKFVPGQPVMPSGNAEFLKPEETESSPLAKQLFSVTGVKSVFLSGDFISVTKEEDKPWNIMKPRIMALIMDHYLSGMPVIDMEAYKAGQSKNKSTGQKDSIDSAIDQQIIELIDTRVRPAVAMDGGDIEFESFDEGVVYLKMKGACSGCPSSTATLKMGIENMLKHFIPEVTEVRPVEG
jgi:Fe-S cluster biogenesis protein NfuA